MNNYKIEFKNIEWVNPIEGVRVKIFREGKKQIRLVEYSKAMPPHWCKKGHYGLILEGRFEIEYNNERIVYYPGDGVFIPDGSEHKHKARVIDETVKVIFVEDVL